MIFRENEKRSVSHLSSELEASWKNLQQKYRQTESDAVLSLVSRNPFTDEQSLNVESFATKLIQNVRAQKPKALSIEGFLQVHQLSSQEGLALMCLAEALLRIPDASTKTKFIRDKLNSGDWQIDNEDSLMQKLTNLGLLTTSKILNWGLGSRGLFSTIASLTRRFGEPVIRQIMAQAMKIMGHQFVMGETIEKALARAIDEEKKGYRYSYDMLGETARTEQDARRYFQAYMNAVIAIGKSVTDKKNIFEMPSLSVKLSALHPRYELAKKERVIEELVPKVLELALKAKELGIGITIDAEESERLTLSLEIIQSVFSHPDLADFEGFGLAIQAYQKRATALVDWLIALAKQQKKRLSIRLVKGAYWDSEIKRTQERGLKDYSVFTQKVYTDVSYLQCANKILDANEWIYPQFATHNAYTLAAVYEMAKSKEVKSYEFQRLHGMGESLYQQITEGSEYGIPCRIYAPVGNYRDLLPYLVRRLLENGANSSFVNQIHDHKHTVDSLIVNPLTEAKRLGGGPHPNIPLPKMILASQRMNSEGLDLWDEVVLEDLHKNLSSRPQSLEKIHPSSEYDIHRTVDEGYSHFEKWQRTSPEERACYLEQLGGMIQHHTIDFIHLLILEGKKTINDALAEVREAVDFCYYYAQQVRAYQSQPVSLPGPTGELNQLSYHPRGVFVCISPWNFPLAIFIGQVTAALGVGNCVIAKSAASTPRVAQMVVDLAYKVGIPKGVLQHLIIPGDQFSEVILKDSRIAGVAFTGSNETAHRINLTLAHKNGPITPFIAETGGINAMIVDSSALAEQVVNDIIASAFQSAGQRCSALRLLLVQNDVADSLVEMLQGAMAELTIGNPAFISTDVGPVIDETAKQNLLLHIEDLEQNPGRARLVYKCEISEELREENYIAPQVWQLSSVRDLKAEIFGPVLHLVRYKGEYLDQVLDDVNSLGYGLTLGLHSRLESTIQQVYAHAKVGNIYVNRNMIGAVVGVQPFGGEGLSGTGPKAGGPNYLLRFMVERTFTQDTTAAGGNASLLAMV
jgi:RHH-type proline utilization regulon transcriptional repressor/proline dehydrogenase/delta 1-pyrroline-5-carboxylate dehydrogenase